MPRLSSGIALSERSQYLFKVLVERYIADGQPVGSRTLARDAKLELSPATIRNVMADLEDLGLIKSPHTSARRIPTVRSTAAATRPRAGGGSRSRAGVRRRRWCVSRCACHQWYLMIYYRYSVDCV